MSLDEWTWCCLVMEFCQKKIEWLYPRQRIAIAINTTDEGCRNSPNPRLDLTFSFKVSIWWLKLKANFDPFSNWKQNRDTPYNRQSLESMDKIINTKVDFVLAAIIYTFFITAVVWKGSLVVINSSSKLIGGFQLPLVTISCFITVLIRVNICLSKNLCEWWIILHIIPNRFCLIISILLLFSYCIIVHTLQAIFTRTMAPASVCPILPFPTRQRGTKQRPSPVLKVGQHN